MTEFSYSSPGIVLLLLDHNRNYSIHLAPTLPRGQNWRASPGQATGQSQSTGPQSTQGSYTRPGQTLVGPRSAGPPLYSRTTPSGGRTPAWVRQRSAPGQLVPPATEWSEHQVSQSVLKQIAIRAVPSVTTPATPIKPLFQTPLAGAEPQPGPGPPPFRI